MKNRTSWINGHMPWNKGLKANQHSSIHVGNKHSAYGKHLSDETKQKIRITKCGKRNPMFGKTPWNKGKCTPEEIKQKLKVSHLGKTSPRKGKHLLEITKQKLRLKHLGKIPWNKGKLCPSSIRCGEKNPGWNGGTSFLPYPPIFNGTLKRLIKERDGNKCQNPDCKGVIFSLVPHHIDYDKENCKLINLITLCKGCNSKANSHREEWQQLYQRIVWRRTTEHFMRMAA